MKATSSITQMSRDRIAVGLVTDDDNTTTGGENNGGGGGNNNPPGELEG